MSAEASKLKGNEFFKNANYNAAWDCYDAAHKEDPTNVIYLANRAQVELKLERYGEVANTCTEALKIDPKFVKCFYRRAVAYGGMLKYSLAIKDFEKVVSLAPSFAEGHAKLQAARALARYTAFQKAIQADQEITILDRLNLDVIKLEEGKNIIDPDLDNLSDSLIKEWIETLKQGKRPSRRTVFDIILRVTKILKTEPTMNDIEVKSEKDTITVCGDVHGQFFDLLHIFDQNGYPSDTHTYVFNGDFVDRGSWSTEVILLLYVLKLHHPTSIYLNRGNHETVSMNTAYGFSGECKAKYGTPQVFEAFSESFNALPLACRINKAYFVVHGGIFSKDGVTIEDIQNIDRFIYKQPPQSGLVMEMLWADPRKQNGIGESKRGIGHEFGPDVTRTFLEKNNLSKIIRSHEVRENGYELEQDDRLITVFSAPNYCDQGQNKGAYINIDEDSKLEFVTFKASWHPDVPAMKYASGLMR